MNKLLPQLPVLIALAFSPCLRAADVSVRDFRQQHFDYGFLEWEELGKVATVMSDGVEIKTEVHGGLGIFFNDPSDWSRYHTLKLKIKKIAADGAMTLVLVTKDDKRLNWVLPTSRLPRGVWKTMEINLDKPDEKKAEETGRSSIQNLQLQSLLEPQQKLHLIIQSIELSETKAAGKAVKIE